MTASVTEVRLTGAPGETWRALLTLAIPTVLGALCRASYALVDTATAGRLGVPDLAGLSQAVFFLWMLHSLSMAASVGTLSCVARAVGARDDDTARSAARRGLMLATGLGVVTGAVLIGIAPAILDAMGLDEAARAGARDYLVVIGLVAPAFWWSETLDAILRAHGEATRPLAVAAIAAALNAVLNPLFALGAGPLEGLGLVGVGLATGLSWALSSTLNAWLSVRRGALKAPAAPAVGDLRILRVGLPVALSGLVFDGLWLVLAPEVAKSGEAAMAAVGIGHRLESLSWLVAFGTSSAAAALVGQAHGMGRPDLVRALAARSLLFGGLLSSALAFALLLVPDVLYGWFTPDVEVWAVGRDYLALCAVPMVLQALELVGLGAFEGTGETYLPTSITFVCYLARVPLMFALGGGATAVFASVAITAATAGTAVVLAFFLVGGKTRPAIA